LTVKATVSLLGYSARYVYSVLDEGHLRYQDDGQGWLRVRILSDASAISSASENPNSVDSAELAARLWASFRAMLEAGGFFQTWTCF
jgi:hypothetical protein